MSNGPTTSDSRVAANRRRLVRGSLAGLLAGTLAAGGWFAAAAGSTKMQAYLMPLIGAAVAYGVHLGMRGAGRENAVVSMAITVLIVVVGLYYVERLLVIRLFEAAGDVAEIPVVPYLDWMWSVLQRAFTSSPSPAVYSISALAAAGWLGHQGFDTHPHRH